MRKSSDVLNPDAPIVRNGRRASSFSFQELIDCGNGNLFGEGNAQLPLPPMLMFDRITLIKDDSGSYNRGLIKAELDIKPELWFFGCHFDNDPVMPGCLGLDAMWQLVGFFLAWKGGLGRGRALGSQNVQFAGQVTPQGTLVSYTVDIKRIVSRSLTVGIADGYMEIDGKKIYEGKDLKVGLFQEGQL